MSHVLPGTPTEDLEMANKAERSIGASGFDASQLRIRMDCCRALFAKLSAKGDSIGADAREQKARLNIWAANMGVFTEGRQSLASRLKDDASEIGNLILRLLHTLQTGLEEAEEQTHVVTTQEDERNSGADDDGSSDEQSECSSTSSYRIANPVEDADTTDVPATLVKLPISIQNTLTRLQQLALIIRDAGKQHRLERIDRFKSLSRNEEIYKNFERCAKQKVDHLFPKASNFLRERMAQSIANRRARFSYLSQHQKKISTLHKLASNDPEAPVEKPQKPEPTPTLERKPAIDPRMGVADGFSRSVAPSRILSNTIDTKLDIKRIREASNQRPESVISVQISTSEFPRVPRVNPEDQSITCPYCCLIYPASEAATEAKWRQHLVQDFEPFFCVHDNCSSPFSCAETYTGWLSHMRTEHTQTEWQCWHCSTLLDKPILFSTSQSLEEHIRDTHIIAESLHATILKHSTAPEPRIFPNGCPFCGGIPEELDQIFSSSRKREAEEALEKHVRGHLIDVALILPPVDSEERDEEMTDDSSDARRGANSVQASDSSVIISSLHCEQEMCDCKDEIKNSLPQDEQAAASADTPDTTRGSPVTYDDPSYSSDADPKLEWEFWYPFSLPPDRKPIGLGEYSGHSNDERLLKYFGIRVNDENLKSFVIRGNEETSNTDSNNRICVQDLCTTDPRHDKARIEEHKGGLLKASYSWILECKEFQEWQDNQSNFLWIRGDPGKGKTMLLCGIINELTQSFGGTANILFFFCQSTDMRNNDATAVLRGLIYSLIIQQPSLLGHVQSRYNISGKSLFEDMNAWNALSQIFVDILKDPTVRTTYIVIDALDECTSGLALLLDLITEVTSTYFQVKWIVSSRNWPEITKRLARSQATIISLELNERSVSQAVHRYIEHEVFNLARQKGYSGELRDTIYHHLLWNSQGTFVWAALVCLGLQRTPKRHARKQLQAFPAGLDAFYGRMIDQIHKLDTDDARVCRQILAVTSIVFRPITLHELAPLIKLPDYLSGDSQALLELVESCGSFLTMENGTVMFVHLSAKEFLLEKMPGEIFAGDIEAEHHKAFARSLQVMFDTLRRDNLQVDIPGIPVEKVVTPSSSPLGAIRYACVYWVDHLEKSGLHNKDDLTVDEGHVGDFLRQKYLHWLEALSLLEELRKGIAAMQKLYIMIQARLNGESNALLRRVQDACQFTQYHRLVIKSFPLQLYSSCLIFSPLSSITKKCYQKQKSHWVLNEPLLKKDWDLRLQSLEESSDPVSSISWSPDGRKLASADGKIVRIWDPATGQCVSTLERHISSVNWIAWSFDGRQLSSASDDKTIIAWDLATGQSVENFNMDKSELLNSLVEFDFESNDSTSTLGCSTLLGRSGYALNDDHSWITYNGHNLLCLPDEYRPSTPSTFAISGNTMAIGCSSGSVIFLALSEQSSISGL